MSEGNWGSEPERRDAPPRRRSLPRADELPSSGDGYDRAAVEAAFDAFYRHAAELDATLDVLEAVDAFQKEAADLRTDIRALRASGWAPTHARQGFAGTYAPRPAPPRSAALDVLPRMAVEAAFIILVGVGAALAGLGPTGVILLVLAAWLVVALGEALAAASRPAPPPPRLAPPHAVEASAAQRVAREPAPTQIVPSDELEAVAVEEEQALEALGIEPEEGVEAAVDTRPEEQTAEPLAPALSEDGVTDGEEAEEAEDAEEEAPRRGFWRRRRDRDAEVPSPEAEAPRHVRVLEGPPDEAAEAEDAPAEAAPPEEAPAAATSTDPWEEGPDAPGDVAAGEAEESPEVPDEADAAAEPPGEDEEHASVAEQAQLAYTALPLDPGQQGEGPPPEEPHGEVPTFPSPLVQKEPEAERSEELEAEREPAAAEAHASDDAPREAVEPEAVEAEAVEPERAEPEAAEPEAEPESEPAEEPAPAAAEHLGEERPGDEPERAGGRWRFWRRRQAQLAEPPEEPSVPQHVRVVEVEQAVLPEDVVVPWDSPREEDQRDIGWGAVEEPQEPERAERSGERPPVATRPEAPLRRRGRR